MGIYVIEALTNLHVGDMGASYSIVDKTVQRDAISGYPCSYSTSLKGALRSAAEKMNFNSAKVKNIFGGEQREISKGKVSFNDAHLLFYPMRSRSRSYYLATCPAMLREAAKICRFAGNSNAESKFLTLLNLAVGKVYGAQTSSGENIWVEEEYLPHQTAPANVQTILSGLIGENAFVLLTDEQMGRLLEELPVIARNQLDNGISQNLWYEEFVPRKSVFLTMTFCDNPNDEADVDCILLGESRNSMKMIQIGANATVGYGYCQFRKL